MRRRKEIKVWRIVATYREYSGTPENTRAHIRKHEYEIKARTLPDAFMVFNQKYRTDGLIGIGITEAKSDEEKEEKPGAGIS
ncbi:MAG: hypothetical protein IJV91_10295 [Kiritimatiellae bacterium]|nr:hypothetical protein [Kiritimatiellia bacterium]